MVDFGDDEYKQMRSGEGDHTEARRGVGGGGAGAHLDYPFIVYMGVVCPVLISQFVGSKFVSDASIFLRSSSFWSVRRVCVPLRHLVFTTSRKGSNRVCSPGARAI
jgi:hypothetical protein